MKRLLIGSLIICIIDFNTDRSISQIIIAQLPTELVKYMAKLGSSLSQYELYSSTRLEDQDEQIYWLKTASESGLQEAQFHHAWYLLFSPWEETKTRGRELLCKVADAGYKDAQWLISRYYQSGNDGFNKDLKKAICYMRKATQKSQVLLRDLAKLYEEVEDYDNAVATYWEAIKFSKWDTESKYRLALLYKAGKGVEQNYKKAFQLFSECVASEKSYNIFKGDALIEIGNMYVLGNHVREDYKIAVECYKQAVQIIYLDSDDKESKTLQEIANKMLSRYKLIMNHGETKHQFQLGLLFYVACLESKTFMPYAISLLTMAADQGYEDANIVLRLIKEYVPWKNKELR